MGAVFSAIGMGLGSLAQGIVTVITTIINTLYTVILAIIEGILSIILCRWGKNSKPALANSGAVPDGHAAGVQSGMGAVGGAGTTAGGGIGGAPVAVGYGGQQQVAMNPAMQTGGGMVPMGGGVPQGQMTGTGVVPTGNIVPGAGMGQVGGMQQYGEMQYGGHGMPAAGTAGLPATTTITY